MNTRLGAMALGVCLTIGSWGLAQSINSTTTENPRVAELIRKLGSSSFMERDRARKELEALGTDALDVLRHANKAADVETKRRIADLIRNAEEQLLTRRVLSAKEIHLKLADATLDQALEELHKLSGYTLQFNGDRTLLANKKFTLDTGKTSFWQALDRFCNEAGLIEKIEPAPPTTNYPSGGVRVGKGRIMRFDSYVPQPTPPSPIILTPGGQEKVFVSYAGAVKSQLRVVRDLPAKELVATWTISAEPRLLNTSLTGEPVIARAVDQQLKQLAVAVGEIKESPQSDDGTLNPTAPHRQIQIRFKNGDGEHSAKQLKELVGKLTVQVDLSNEPLARIEKILDASGKSVAGANGGSLSVNAVRKNGDEIEVQVTMQDITPNPFGNNVIVNGGNVIIRGNVIARKMVIGPNGIRIDGGADNANALPDLFDARGQKYKIASSTSDGINFVNGSCSQTVTIRYRANAEQGAPSELVLFGIRTHTIAVPFRFENVPLP